MLKKASVLALLCMGVATSAFAATSSNENIVLNNNGWTDQNDRATVLLIETTSSAVGQAITECGQAYDLFSGSDFSGVNLTGYDHVFLAMDGGTVTDASILNASNYVNAGGNFHIYGGTCWQEYAIAMDNYLVENDINNYCWTTVGGSPHSTVVDPGHYLAAGLPLTYNFADLSASYYQLRTTDAGLWVAAVNGDGYNHLFSKAVGGGVVDACINSAYYFYYTNPSDYNWLKQVVCNMLAGGQPTATENTSWGTVKALYR
jgi:hypothetical protein